MEDKKIPYAPQPEPEDNEAFAASDPAGDLDVSPVVSATEPIAAPASAPAVPAPAPKQPAGPVAAPKPAPAPTAPVAPVAPPTAPAVPAAPAASVVPTAPAAPAAPAAPVAPPTPQSAVPQPAFASNGPAQMPTASASGPAQPFMPQQPFANGGYGAYPPPSAPNGYAPRSGKAVGALVCGILAILLSGFPIFGVILGIVAIVLAGKAVKEAGKDGKATGGKVCGIIGIVLSLLWFVFGLGIFAIGIASFDEGSGAVVSSSSSAMSMTADEQAAAAAVEVELDKYVDQDPAALSALSLELDESLLSIDETEMSHSALGVDMSEYAAWAVTDFSYAVDNVFIDESARTATVYVNTTARDSFEVYSRFNELLTDYDASGAPQNSDFETVKSDICGLWNQAMDETAVMCDYFAAFDLVKKGDEWVVVPESLDEEVDYIFGTL